MPTLELNRSLRKYSGFEAEQNAYEAMQQVGFQIAQRLMEKPRGTMAPDLQGHAYWVSPLHGMSDLFCTPDYQPLSKDSNVFAVSDFDGQSASGLDEIREAMQKWLDAPVFIECDADFLDSLVTTTYAAASQ